MPDGRRMEFSLIQKRLQKNADDRKIVIGRSTIQTRIHPNPIGWGVSFCEGGSEGLCEARRGTELVR